MRGIWRLKKFRRDLEREVRISMHKLPIQIQCNLCGWKGRTLFSDSWHPHTICPRCSSQLRHRLLVQTLSTIPSLHSDLLIKGKRVLHFAPEHILQHRFSLEASRYVTADFHRDSVDMQLDICDMQSVADGAFDLVIACDVLEHVQDDAKAIREIHRVLADNGWAIFTVPQKDNLETTYEDVSITTPEARTEAFGQHDHLRIYGTDFPVRVENCGFSVTAVDELDFDADEVRRHVLFPPILSDHPLATNHRKVFFARKRPAQQGAALDGDAAALHSRQ